MKWVPHKVEHHCALGVGSTTVGSQSQVCGTLVHSQAQDPDTWRCCQIDFRQLSGHFILDVDPGDVV